MAKIVTDEELRAALSAYQEVKNYAEAGRLLGLPRSTVQSRVEMAVRRNILGSALLETKEADTPPGTEVTKVSQHFDKEGNPTNLWLQMKPMKDVNEALDAIHDAFKQYDGFLKPRKVTPETQGNLLTLYPVPDLHLGMQAWRKETGEAYDLNIAYNLLRDKMTNLVERMPPSEMAVLLNLGDFFHADNNEAATPKSHNHLDVDNRHQKTLHMGAELMLECIDLLRQKHNYVLVRCLPGNHDPISSVALTDALFWATSHTPEVDVDIDPSPFWEMRFGKTMLAAHHGHLVKPTDFAGTMSAYWPEDWGNSDFRYGLQGHLHRAIRIPSDEHDGAEIRVLGTLAAKDAWNRGMGHASQRTLHAIAYSEAGGIYEEKFEVVRPEELK